jgi:hypothetical protein
MKSSAIMQGIGHLQLPSRYAIALNESNRFKHEITTSDASSAASAFFAASVSSWVEAMQTRQPLHVCPGAICRE